MRRSARALGLLILGLTACSSKPAPCGDGEAPQGGACVKVPLDCGEAAVARDGVCAPIGVVTCGSGFSPDGHAGCVATLATGCGKDSVAFLGETACTRVGVGACAPGFLTDGEGGCTAVLPACPSGQTAVPGDAACRPVAACGTDPYGSPPVDLPVLYVDAAAIGPTHDGTRDHPFTTIGAALTAATAETTVAIAAGTYLENLVLSRAVRLHGRCPELVGIEGNGSAPTLTVQTKSRISRVAVTQRGTGRGIDVLADTTLSESLIHDTGSYGVRVGAAASLVVKDSLIERAVGVGVLVEGATVTLDRVVVRDTAPTAKGLGMGLLSFDDAVAGRAKITITASVFDGNTNTGVAVEGSVVRIDASVIRRTKPRADGFRGRGIEVHDGVTSGAAAELTLLRSIVDANAEGGVVVLGSTATIEDTVVRDTATAPGPDLLGRGIELVSNKDKRGKLTVRRSVSRGNHDGGIHVAGSDATLEDTLVLDSRVSHAHSNGGVVFQASPDGKLRSVGSLKRTLVHGSDEVGVVVSGGRVTLDQVVVRESRATSKEGGDGLGFLVRTDALGPADVDARRLVVDRVQTAGIIVVGSKLSLVDSLVRDTLPGLLGDHGRGLELEMDGDLRPSATVQRCVFEGNREVSILSGGGLLEVDSTVVRGTLPGPLGAGGGLVVLPSEDGAQQPTLTLTSSLIADNPSIGLFLSGQASVSKTIVRGTVAADAKFGDGIVTATMVLGATTHVVLSEIVSRGNARAGLNILSGEVSVTSASLRCNALEFVTTGRGFITDGGGVVCGCTVPGLCLAQTHELTPVDLPKIGLH